MSREKVVINPALNEVERKEVRTVQKEFDEIFLDLPGKTAVLKCSIR